MTREEYWQKVQTFDQDRIQAAIDNIDKRINPTGKLYKKKLQEIYKML